MKSLKFHLLLAFVLIAYTLLLSHPVFPSYEYGLMDGMNRYRMSLKLDSLSGDPQAKCLADKLSDQLKSRACNAPGSANYTEPIPAYSGGPFTHYDKVLSKCNIGVHHATDAFILPVCVPDPYPVTWTLAHYTDLLLTRFNCSSYQGYINNSKFTGYGADCQDNWMVVVLSTNTSEGNLNSAAVGLALEVGMDVYLVALLLGVVGLVLTS